VAAPATVESLGTIEKVSDEEGRLKAKLATLIGFKATSPIDKILLKGIFAPTKDLVATLEKAEFESADNILVG